MSATTCPSRDELFDYVVGRLSDEDSDGVSEHLELCESCQAGLATFDDADDTLVAQLRLPDDEDPYQGESQCQVAVAQARAVAGRPVSPGQPADPASTHSLLLGTLGEYQLLEKLGRGGMGTVYKAMHTKLDRVVALKVLPKSRSDDEKAIARFEREMKAIGRLDHPNIVGAYDAREIEDKPVLIMEYVEGLDLAKLVRRCGPLSVADACELARQAALGLQYAHEHGLVHRDVKPSNLMLTPQGEVKILDLGLARFHRAEGDCPDFRAAKMGLSPSPNVHEASPDSRAANMAQSPSDVRPTTPDEMTGSGQAMGTADYMAPEQASDSRAVDIRADVYSLGCTLYKLLTGRAPFGGPDHKGTFEKMTAHVREPVPPIGEFDAQVPDELAAVLDRMLAKEPDERYATPGDVAEALRPFCIECDLAGLLVQAKQAEAAEPPSSAVLRDGSSAAPESQPTPLPFWRRW
ncbi:MAG: serine/threonine-protein kinase, partial [Planctomycetota bacterium]